MRKYSRQDRDILVYSIHYPYVPVQGSQEVTIILNSVGLNLHILLTPGIFANNQLREVPRTDFEIH